MDPNSAQGRAAILWGPVASNIVRFIQKGLISTWGPGATALHAHFLETLEEPAMDQKRAFLRELEKRTDVNGLLVICLTLDSAEYEHLRARNFPVVTVEGSDAAQFGTANVVLDHASGARDVAMALLEHGRKRIGFVGPVREQRWAAAAQRVVAVREVLEKSGLALEAEDEDRFNFESGYEATLRLLARAPDIDALICSCDIQALGGMKALRESNKGIPSDIAVVSFDDSTAASGSTPPLASVRQPLDEAARIAADILSKAMRGESGITTRTSLAETLILRESLTGIAGERNFGEASNFHIG